MLGDVGEYSVRRDAPAPNVNGVQLPDFDDRRVHRITPREATEWAEHDQRVCNDIFGYDERVCPAGGDQHCAGAVSV